MQLMYTGTTLPLPSAREQREQWETSRMSAGFRIIVLKPLRGYRQVLQGADIRAFIGLLPDWETRSEGLCRIEVSRATKYGLVGAQPDVGRHGSTIRLPAWRRDLSLVYRRDALLKHRPLLDRLGVDYQVEGEELICRFTETQARAFSLLHHFLQELGQHSAQRNHAHASPDSDDAAFGEVYAWSKIKELWPKYVEAFGDPRA